MIKFKRIYILKKIMSTEVRTWENEIKTQLQYDIWFSILDKKISPEEAKNLLEKYDFKKEEILQVIRENLKTLKNQLWNDITAENFQDYLEEILKNYLDTNKPDKEVLYDGITDFADFQESEKISVDLKNPKKPENIDDEKWKEAQKLLKLAKNLDIKEAKVSFTKENWIVLELDTTWSDIYVKLSGDNVIVTGQNWGNLFVEQISQTDFEKFVKNYDNKESKRILEQIWFTGWMTLGWVLAFSIRTWIGFLLWAIWTWYWVFKAYELQKNYRMSQNESLSVLKDLKQEPEVVKSYLFLSQIWYITWYDNWVFKTIDWEKITWKDLANKEKNIKPEKYQLLRWLSEKWFSPKFISEWRYELDMHGLWDKSPLVFEWETVKFSTSSFENGKSFEWIDVKVAFEKIWKINEILKLEAQLKNQNTTTETSYIFSDKSQELEDKINRLKNEI